MVDKTLDKINTFVPEKWRWVLLHGGFRKYFKNTGWMMVTKILSFAISFISTIIIARRLGPENLGQISYSVSFIAIFSFLTFVGLDQILYRDLIKYPEKKNEYLGSALTIRLIAGFITLLIAITTAFFVKESKITIILITIISFTYIFSSFQIFNYEFQARVKAKFPSIASFIVILVLNILKIITVLLGGGIIFLAIILLLEPILYALFYLYIYRFKLKERFLDLSFNYNISKELIKDSWPLIITGAFSFIYSRIDQIFIKNLIDVKSVGYYDAAVRISEVWYFIPAMIITSLFPAIINSKKLSISMYRNRLIKLFWLLLIISILISIPVFLFSSFIIKFLYGFDFLASIPILKIYVWAGVGVSLSTLVNTYLISENYRKIIFFTSFIAMSINVILNLFWIPLYGINGAAFSTLVSYSATPLLLFIFKKTRKDFFAIIKNGALSKSYE